MRKIDTHSFLAFLCFAKQVNTVQAEAERLQKGWGAGVFSQAYQMLRKDREDEVRAEAAAKEAAVLSISFTKLSGDVVTFTADGRKVTQQTQLSIRPNPTGSGEVAFKSEVNAELKSGAGARFLCMLHTHDICMLLSRLPASRASFAHFAWLSLSLVRVMMTHRRRRAQLLL